MKTTISEHIAVTPGVCGGRPRIAGHRIRVQDVAVWHEDQGMAPEEIVSGYPGITLADVYSALAYYHDHRDEIRGQIAEDEALAAAMKKENPSLLAKKLSERDAQDPPISPR